MDPAATLAEIKTLTETINNAQYPRTQDIERLAELVDGLGEWKRKGGFMPIGWTLTVAEASFVIAFMISESV